MQPTRRTRKGIRRFPKPFDAKGGTSTKADNLAMAQRRMRVADLYLQGVQQTCIAQRLDVSTTLISRDLDTLHQQWVDSGIRDLDIYKHRELRRIDRIESEAWTEWERSKLKRNYTKYETGSSPQGPIDKTITGSEEQCGDPRYLAVVQKCIDQRRALLGLDVADEVAGRTGEAVERYAKMATAVLDAMLKRARG